MKRYDYFRLFSDISPADYERLTEHLRPKSCRKGELLVVPGQVQRELYFVNKGVQMSYADTDSKTHVIAFTYAPNLCAIPESFSFQKASGHFLTCLTDSEFDILSFEALEELFNQSQGIERLFRRMAETLLAGVINRHVELHSLTIEERFRTFCQRSPHLLQLVPHKYLASYLGIDPTNFSKLFNNVRV